MEKENFWLKIIYILSAVLSLAVGFLILGPRPDGIEGAIDVSGLPYVNAFLNLITTALLIIGYILIRQKICCGSGGLFIKLTDPTDISDNFCRSDGYFL